MEQAMNAMQAQMNAGFESMRAAFQTNMASGFANYNNTEVVQLCWGSGPSWQGYAGGADGKKADDAHETFLSNNAAIAADVVFKYAGQGAFHAHNGEIQNTVEPFSRVCFPTPVNGTVELIVRKRGATTPDAILRQSTTNGDGMEIVINQAPDGRLVPDVPPPYTET